MRRIPFRTASIAVALATSLAFTACGGDGKKDDAKQQGDTATTATTTAPDKVQGSVASYDLAVGPAGRFMFGMFNEAKGVIGYGTAAFSFFFLGENSASGTPQPGPTATGTYLRL